MDACEGSVPGRAVVGIQGYTLYCTADVLLK